MHEPAVIAPELAKPQTKFAGPLRETVKRPEVLMLISHFPPAVGDTERQVHGLSVGLAAAGYRVTVLTPAHPGAPAIEMRDGIAIERALTETGRGPLFDSTSRLSILRDVRQLQSRRVVLHVGPLYLEANELQGPWWSGSSSRPAFGKTEA